MQYDEVAEEYERHIAPKYRPIASLVADRMPRAAGQAVVELAAGTGLLTRLLAPRVVPGGSYLATDVAARMLDVARRHVPTEVELTVADLHAVPAPDGSADVVVASLSPAQDTLRGFREAHRLLRPGGRLLLGFWGGNYSEQRLLAAARRDLELTPYPTSNVSRVKRRAATAGFVDITIDRARLDVTHDDVESYLTYRAAFGWPPSLPARRERDIRAALRRHARPFVQHDGRIRLDWTIRVLRATRPIEQSATAPARADLAT
jgi:SAM-dependent methyltransferase